MRERETEEGKGSERERETEREITKMRVGREGNGCARVGG